jgi:dynein heavy chain
MERRLNAASKLISGLEGEKIRWSADSQRLKEDKIKLVGDCLLSSSFLSYTGPFNFNFRMRMVYEDWSADLVERTIPMTDDFHVEQLLTNDVECARWASEGLPQDELSVQNGILTTHATRWPLCIDPQEQAVVWIREKEKQNNLVKTSLNEANYAKQLEGAIRYGFSVIFENIDEELDPMIDPVLEKAYVT